jgi:hypothetical protein
MEMSHRVILAKSGMNFGRFQNSGEGNMHDKDRQVAPPLKKN